MSATSDPRYPIGSFEAPARVTTEAREGFIRAIAAAPAALRAALEGLTDAQLGTPYRDGGWTLRQVAHHLPDSHMNAYVRMRLALTEDEPAVKGYAEDRWAELPDARTGPVAASLLLLESLHARWVLLLEALEQVQWSRAYRHSEMGVVPLDRVLALYAWHGRHHVAQIVTLRRARDW